MFFHCSNSSEKLRRTEGQWASSNLTIRLIASLDPSTREWMTASYQPLEDEGQPCRCPLQLPRLVASRAHCSMMGEKQSMRVLPL
ncbi:UNVERIFIED_CONTAM: hypothetical protein FKN15_019646 [Acipenser sinensis]